MLNENRFLELFKVTTYGLHSQSTCTASFIKYSEDVNTFLQQLHLALFGNVARSKQVGSFYNKALSKVWPNYS